MCGVGDGVIVGVEGTSVGVEVALIGVGVAGALGKIDTRKSHATVANRAIISIVRCISLFWLFIIPPSQYLYIAKACFKFSKRIYLAYLCCVWVIEGVYSLLLIVDLSQKRIGLQGS